MASTRLPRDHARAPHSSRVRRSLPGSRSLWRSAHRVLGRQLQRRDHDPRKGTETSFTPIADVTPGGTSYVDASLSSGTTYCYRLLAYNATTASPYSSEACATTSTDGSTRSVTISKNGAGRGLVASTPTGIRCDPTCAAAFASTTVVTLAAAPEPGYVHRLERRRLRRHLDHARG